MYLKVQYNNSIKQYTLTNNYNKPYIKVNGSILPLTTNTTQGLHIKINHNNTTYRPLEYNSMSTSNTYYTSGINSNGLSSTTALTRSSTYDTQYYTRSSTYDTVYYTRSSTSGTNYLTKTVSKNEIVNHTYLCTIYNSQYISYGTWCALYSSSSRSRTDYGYYQAYTYNVTDYYLYLKTVTITSSNPSNTYYTVSSSAKGIYVGQLDIGNTVYTYYEGNSYYQRYIQKSYTNQEGIISFTSSSLRVYTPVGASKTSILQTYIIDLRSVITQTTGTQYLTRSSTSATSYLTRSSTYSTVYLTRSSTSGYSGVSSSSSQSSGWL